MASPPPSRPTVNGLVEASLYVQDLDRSQRFYESLFGFEVLLRNERMCSFAITQGQVLLLFLQGASTGHTPVPGGIVPPHDGAGRLHLAFSISKADLTHWREHLASQGLAIESTINPPRGGTSLYFRDPDGHLIELATPGIWAVY